MKILAVETSTPTGSVAVSSDMNILAEMSINTERTHSETLIINIDHVLKSAGVKIKEIDGIAVSKGPGMHLMVACG